MDKEKKDAATRAAALPQRINWRGNRSERQCQPSSSVISSVLWPNKIANELLFTTRGTLCGCGDLRFCSFSLLLPKVLQMLISSLHRFLLPRLPRPRNFQPLTNHGRYSWNGFHQVCASDFVTCASGRVDKRSNGKHLCPFHLNVPAPLPQPPGGSIPINLFCVRQVIEAAF